MPTKWRDMEDDDFNLPMDHLEVSENIYWNDPIVKVHYQILIC